MSKIFFSLAAMCCIGLALFSFAKSQTMGGAQTTSGKTSVLYCREQPCDQQIINELERAQKYAYFAMYTLTRPEIVDALIAAKLRGVDVCGVVDFNQALIDQEKPEISKLKRYGIEIKSMFKTEGLMHIKMLITENTYSSGSYNWTTTATTLNDEVLEIGSNQSLHDEYLRIFNVLWKKYKDI